MCADIYTWQQQQKHRAVTTHTHAYVTMLDNDVTQCLPLLLQQRSQWRSELPWGEQLVITSKERLLPVLHETPSKQESSLCGSSAL